MLRTMLQCIYILSFLCLLRSDEALHIRWEHLDLYDKATGKMKLTLPFRKTHQYGGTLQSNENLELTSNLTDE